MSRQLDTLTGAGLVLTTAIDAERDADGTPLEFMPQQGYANPHGLRLNPHGTGPFCRLRLPRLSTVPGTYAITIDDSVVYVGECQNFAERFGPRGYGVIHPRNCFERGQPTNCKINHHILETLRTGRAPLLWFTSETGAGRKALERDLIDRLRPPWNARL